MYNISLKVLKEIEKNGFKAYIVGGYARDLYLNRKSYDVDICTSATPMDLRKIFIFSFFSKCSYFKPNII